MLVGVVYSRDSDESPNWTPPDEEWLLAVASTPTADTPRTLIYYIEASAARSGAESFSHDGVAKPLAAWVEEWEPGAGETLTLDEIASAVVAGGGGTDRPTGTTLTTGGATIQVGAVANRNGARTLSAIQDLFTERVNGTTGTGFTHMVVAGGDKVEAAAEAGATGWTVNNASGSNASGAIAAFLVTEDEGGVTGAAALVLPALAQAADAAASVRGDAAVTLPALQQDAAGDLAVEGAAAQTLPALVQNAIGAVEIDGVAGAAASALPALAQAVAGALGVTVDAATGLPALGQAAQGALVVVGEAGGVLGQFAQAAEGALKVAGDGASTLPTLEQALAGAVPVSGAVASVLPALGAALEGRLGVKLVRLEIAAAARHELGLSAGARGIELAAAARHGIKLEAGVK